MKFRTEVDVKSVPWPLKPGDAIFLVGSCFTENIGKKLREYKFSVLENPHGILFNPVSVADSITDCINGLPYNSDNLFSLNEAWHSWKHHSRFSSPDPADAVEKMNRSLNEAHSFLKQANYLMITLGSAWVYQLNQEAPLYQPSMIVANNHKAPANFFHKKLLTAEEVLQVLDPCIHRLRHFNPELKIFFTISPVRHLREGAVENNRSKAVLMQAVHHLVNKFDGLYYFPAYELVIDDLRDYRFYSEDLVHPNYQATQYVWEKFVDSCLDRKARELIAELQPINLALKHKPFHPSSSAHNKFLKAFEERTKLMVEKYPGLDFSSELEFFSGRE